MHVYLNESHKIYKKNYDEIQCFNYFACDLAHAR